MLACGGMIVALAVHLAVREPSGSDMWRAPRRTWGGRVAHWLQWVLLLWLVAAPVVAWKLDADHHRSSSPSPFTVRTPPKPSSENT